MSRFEAAILSITVVLALTSACLLVPFDVNSNVLAVIGFAIVVSCWDEKLPRHVFDGVTAMVGRVFDMVGRVFDMVGLVVDRVFHVVELVLDMMRRVFDGVTAMVRGISRGMASAAGTFWTAIMSMFGDLRQAMIGVWPYAKIEDITTLLSMAALLVFAPAIANGLAVAR